MVQVTSHDNAPITKIHFHKDYEYMTVWYDYPWGQLRMKYELLVEESDTKRPVTMED